MRRRGIGGVRAGLVLALAWASAGVWSPAAVAQPVGDPAHHLAGSCVTVTGADGTQGIDGIRGTDGLEGVGPFAAKASGLGRFLFAAATGELIVATAEGAALGGLAPAAEWTVTTQPGGAYTLASTLPDGPVLAGVRLEPTVGCTPFPEAEIGVEGEPFTGTSADGSVRGFADSHAHLTAHLFLGGALHCGTPYSPLGVTVALQDCPDHGDDGWPAVAEHALSRPGPHDTTGWPDFPDWPAAHSLTHEQSYHRWIERAWRAGLRTVTTYYVQNRVLCELYPLGDGTCDEMESVRIQHRELLAMRDYIDAQAGGPGRGFLQIVDSAAQAREVVAAGKLAVFLGIEVSEPFGCAQRGDVPACTEADIDAGLDELQDMGIRQVVLTHKFDNALGGTRFDQGATGGAVELGQVIATGHGWQTEPCDGEQQDNPTLSAGGDAACNVRGLTALGEHAVTAMMDRRMVVDLDHLGVKTARRVVELVNERGYPGIVSSHTWTDHANYRSILDLGGAVGLFATTAEAEPGERGRHGDMPPDFVSAWRILREHADPDRFFGLGFGPDMGGLGAQAPARPSAASNPVVYPFTAADGVTVVDRQITGNRVFDVNVDGTAHYGLLPDWIESVRVQAGPDGDAIVADLFRGAEAYLRMWDAVDAPVR
ncbi:sphingolipid ceramide N-deacylase [Rhodococcus rhodnii]|uniref:Sphingolipid ceramide N-deacylase n=2 Tax=Rhodococcus rhodnii TaxID=38312 RepID=R7WHX0_9NOCA|nr:membrane dipeptidase [Rhodococcus rhodnii]EOM74743.1 hypothetical protein Rrhod_3906 [Rhodococcus rhodnii LMG 5362]TXG89842.1 sphingolipid ceramide N-deacylase [Rhodococcus rhodnii]